MTIYSHCPFCDFPRDRARPHEYSCGSTDHDRSRECELRNMVETLEVQLSQLRHELKQQHERKIPNPV
mgnify:CR=1 FL=1